MAISFSDYGKLSDGRDVKKYVISNNTICASILTYGATLAELFTQDKNGKTTDILVGFDDLEGFEHRTDYQGVVVGPYANRIGGASFVIDGIRYNLTANEKDVTCLHSNGEFNTAVWDAEILGEFSVKFTYSSPDGCNGFPGNTDVSVIYSLTDKNELKLEYSAVSDKKTVINLTNHAYFNLGGVGYDTILDHKITINADKFTPVDEFSIPTGEIRCVENTPFDLRNNVTIGDNIDFDCDQLNFTGGYDHNFCINDYDGAIKKAAEVYCDKTGICLEVYTDLPGVQFYAGNFLNGAQGKNKLPLNKRSGFCLETQYFPDTPNRPEFPQCTYEAGEVYKTTTIFKLSTK